MLANELLERVSTGRQLEQKETTDGLRLLTPTAH
jgi:hypothetical protein